MNITIVIVIGLVLAGLVLACVWLYQQFQQKKREAYKTWADLHGWSYNPYPDRKQYLRFSFLERLQRLNFGSNRYALDTLQGKWNGYRAEVFNFHYQTSSLSSDGTSTVTTTHYLGVVIIQVECFFPKLLIHQKSTLSKLWDTLKSKIIDEELIEFSKKFTVSCHDQKFAYDFCHPRMMEYFLNFLSTPGDMFELNENIFVLFKEGNIKIDEIEDYLTKLMGIITLAKTKTN